MPFTVRLDGETIATYDTEGEALAHAAQIVREDADQQPEVLDAQTGRAVAPGASAGSREHLARKVGY